MAASSRCCRLAYQKKKDKGRYGVSIFNIGCVPFVRLAISPTRPAIYRPHPNMILSGSSIGLDQLDYLGTPTANAARGGCVFQAWSWTQYSFTPFSHSPLQTGRAMSFFPNSSGFIINGGEFVNNEGTNKIEKGKHIFVHI